MRAAVSKVFTSREEGFAYGTFNTIFGGGMVLRESHYGIPLWSIFCRGLVDFLNHHADRSNYHHTPP